MNPFLKKMTLKELLIRWLDTLSPNTKRNYSSGINIIDYNGIIDLNTDVQAFAALDHSIILEKIKELTKSFRHKPLAEASKQARAACYISFTKFVSRVTKGYVPKALPIKDFGNATFFKIRDKVKSPVLVKKEWVAFFEVLKRYPRAYLIGKLILHGLRRIREVLDLNVKDICFEKNQILFHRQLRKKLSKKIFITYPENVMGLVRKQTENKHFFLFPSNILNVPLSVHSVYLSFEKASKLAGIPFKVTPSVLRASSIVFLKQLGFSNYEIMKVSGHASFEMVSAYDLNLEDNMSQKFSLMF
ncbi:tyrosine-type recombinase/integrase [Candidatus Clavichlamydia salmonicola]|uniref:tyrosine-type recombinase/integrase n=1 Tax=Candidatus Clavichlamydia salmonicola TaxID=469812 RepID=UPI001891B422|nr:site-specific integrase [Candidatus Clavichlamydia salmonicola]